MSYVIGSRCICCHYCASECPAEAINYVKSKYEIDLKKCTECGMCVELCPVSQITNTEAAVAEPKKRDLEHLSCDILVLGAGGSGLVAAVRAAEISGKKVIVLEKAKKAGGSTTLAHGFMIVYCKWLRDAGVPDNTEEIIERSMRQARGNLSRSLIEKIVRTTGLFFDWLCEKGEAEKYFTVGKGHFTPMGITYPNRSFENLKSRDQSIGPGWAGTYVIRKMMQMCEKLDIQVLTEHAGRRLLTDEQGRISGVIADNPGGQVQIDCKACIIATGGFSGSDEKLSRIVPDFFGDGIPVHRFSPPTCTGDGMDLAAQVGGRIDLNKIKVNLWGPTHHPFTHSVNRMVGPATCMVTLEGMLVVDTGMRAMDDRSLINSLPGKACYYIIDSKTIEERARQLIENPPDGNDDWIYRDYMKDIESELKCDRPAKKGNTLEELAGNMGVDADFFVSQIEEYNRSVNDGKVSDFPGLPPGMEEDFFGEMPRIVPRPVTAPPYYAFFGQRFTEGAFGGVITNENIEVIKESGEVIPGLYATGDAAGTWFTKGLLGPLTELTWAVTSGYIAGGNAAEYIGGRKSQT